METSPGTFPEINRERRGHAFYDGLSEAPEPYSTEEVSTEEKTVVAHYFNGNSDWYVVELDSSRMEVFGYAVLGGCTTDGEWGYFDLPSLESLDVPGLLVERDVDWVACSFPEAIAKRH